MSCIFHIRTVRAVLVGAGLLLTQGQAVLAGPVNINTADANTLAQELKGIGLKRAQAIVDYRAKHGPFKSADELSLIKGIGTKVIQRNRGDIRVSGSAAPAPAAAARPATSPQAVPAPARR